MVTVIFKVLSVLYIFFFISIFVYYIEYYLCLAHCVIKLQYISVSVSVFFMRHYNNHEYFIRIISSLCLIFMLFFIMKLHRML